MTAPSGTAAPQARPRRAAPSPRAVTRGEEKQQQRAIVDWLHATFAKPVMSIEGLVSFLGRLFGRPIRGVSGGGLLGFKESVSLIAGVASREVTIGHIAMGGEAQNGRWLLQITGGGCGLLNDWDGMRELLEGLDAKLTRVDLAVDFLDGEYTVDDAVDLHCGGFFAFEGKMAPKTRFDGDWLDGVAGRSFYVGKAENGKMLRVYEKGRQLGNEDSDWVRFEVQLGNRDRVIPFDVLTDRDTFFAGAYPALELMLEQAGERIRTQQKGGEVSIAHVMFHLKRCYGKALDTCAGLGATDADLIEELRIVGLPRRVNPSSLAAGLTWAQVHAQLRK